MESEKKFKFKVSFNSPVILSFTIVCFVTLLLDKITLGNANNLLFSVYRAPLSDPLTYVRLFTHVIGHADWNHFIGNIMTILIVGPLLEEKYGWKNMLVVIFSTAFVTGIIHFLLFPHTALLGASGVVFALIVLSSITSIKSGSIPLTFILVSVLYIGGQIFEGIFVIDNVSNLTHIIGGVVGAVTGMLLNKK